MSEILSAPGLVTPQQARQGAPGMGLDDNVYQRLLQQRIIWLGTEVRDDMANAICAQLLLLAAEDPDADIFMYINSPGGSVSAGMSIYDTMQYIKPDVSTLCLGQAASMGAVLLAGGAAGKRFTLPYARVMIHQPLGGASGQAKDIELEAREILHIADVLYGILAKHTGQEKEKVHRDCDRNFYFDAPAAQKYGLVDKVIEKHTQTSPELSKDKETEPKRS